MLRLDRALEEEICWAARTNPKMLSEFKKSVAKSIGAGSWPTQREMADVLATFRQIDASITEQGRNQWVKCKENKDE